MSPEASESRPKSYCSSCRHLFSPQGLRQASAGEGFFHSRVDRNGGLPCRHECDLCSFLNARFFDRASDLPGEEAGAQEDGHVLFMAVAEHEGDEPLVNELICEFVPRDREASEHTPRKSEKSRWMSTRESFLPVADFGCPASDFISRRPAVAPNSQAAFDAANDWLSTCLEKHERCDQGRDLSLPTRVLDIMPSGDTVKLYAPVTFEEGQYACLSYCWGGDQEVVLTQASLKTFCNGVSIGVLGRTIQDAIEVTRKLGLRYLWVDALCIIQDSDGDKDTELGRMSKVYSNSTVTIAAADAVSSTSGFLQRDGLNDQGLVFAVPFQHGSIMLYPRKGDSAKRRLDDYHLNTRAWTLQEMLLSTRILFYTRTELLWICEEDYMKPVSPTRYDYDGSRSDRKSWHTILNLVERKEGFGEEWRNLVGLYTRRQMTFKGDRLRAIQALIDTVETISGQRCLHGMWERSLLCMIGWHVLGVLASAHRSPLGAPTWSWASVNDPVCIFGVFTGECLAVRLLGIRGDEALGLEAILIPTSGTRELFAETSGLHAIYYPDVQSQPIDEALTESFYMPLNHEPGPIKFLEVMRTHHDVFVRTGFLICYSPLPDQLKGYRCRFETRQIWLG